MGMPTASVQQSPNQGGGKGHSMGNPPAQQMQQMDDMVGDITPTDPSMMTTYGGPNGQPQPMGGQAMGKGGRNYTMPGQGGQPRIGMPNAYSNTIQPWDNASIQPQRQSGKGKGY